MRARVIPSRLFEGLGAEPALTVTIAGVNVPIEALERPLATPPRGTTRPAPFQSREALARLVRLTDATSPERCLLPSCPHPAGKAGLCEHHFWRDWPSLRGVDRG